MRPTRGQAPLPGGIANVRFIKADGETGTIPCKSGFVFLMNDDGKTVDKF